MRTKYTGRVNYLLGRIPDSQMLKRGQNLMNLLWNKKHLDKHCWQALLPRRRNRLRLKISALGKEVQICIKVSMNKAG